MLRVELERLPYSVGVSARDRQGTFYFSSDSRFIYKAEPGGLDCPSLLHDFEETTLDVRGIFVSYQGDVFVGLKGFRVPPFGRTYRFAVGRGTPQLVLSYCFWGMDEDILGRLYLGVYHERPDPDCVCKVFCSLNSGTSWLDISPGIWLDQTHVHHLAINPSSQYLYVTLGDVDTLDGCWRSRSVISKAVMSDQRSVVIDCKEFAARAFVGERLYLFIGIKRIETRIAAIAGNVIKLIDCIPAHPGDDDLTLFKQDWLHKFHNHNKGCQYIGLGFDGDTVVLSDDTGPQKNASNALIYIAHDIDDDPTTPEATFFSRGYTEAWGCFFLERDDTGGYWTAVRPVHGDGMLCYSRNARDWTVISIFPEQDLNVWRKEHTLRDFTICQTGHRHGSDIGGWLLSGAPGILIRTESSEMVR